MTFALAFSIYTIKVQISWDLDLGPLFFDPHGSYIYHLLLYLLHFCVYYAS